MPRNGREDDRSRSSPYNSSGDRRSHRHKSHGSDDKGFNRKDWNQNGERDQHEKQDRQTTGRYYGGRSKNEDYGSRRNQESSRYHEHSGDREKQYRQRSPSRSDDKSHSKRTSGFDVAPSAGASLQTASEGKIALCL